MNIQDNDPVYNAQRRVQRQGVPQRNPQLGVGPGNINISSYLPLTERIQNYKKLRNFVVKGISQIREELLPLLYQFYLHLYFKAFHEKAPREARDIISAYRNDFFSVNSFLKEISYIETLTSLPTDEKIKEDPILNQIFYGNKTLFVTQFTFESLMSFIRKNRLDEYYTYLLTENRITIRTVSDPETEANKMPNGIVSNLTYDEIKKINESQTKLVPLKDDVLFLNKLDTFYTAKMRNELNLASKKVKDKLASDIDVPESNYLEKSEIPLPDTKLKFKVDFAKAYLDRVPLTEPNEPNILNLSIRDPHENVTVMEIERAGNVVIYGFLDGKILVVVLNPFFDEINSLEKNKKKYIDQVGKNVLAIDEEPDPKKEKDKEKGGAFPREEDKYEIIEFRGHEEAITSISIHYDELYFISASVDTSIRLWCMRQRSCIGVYKGHVNNIWKVKFASKGYYFASGSSDTTARIWATDKSFAIRTLVGHTSDVHLVEFSENCNYLITASYDKTIRIWEIYSGKCMKILFHNNEVVSALAISFLGNYLATGSEDGLVIFWDLNQNTKINAFHLENAKRINSISFSIDETYMSVSSKKRISYYSIDRVKNEQGDMYDGLLRGDMKSEATGFNESSLATNSYFMNDIPEYDFMNAKFSTGNFIFVLSRSFS